MDKCFKIQKKVLKHQYNETGAEEQFKLNYLDGAEMFVKMTELVR